MKAAVRYTTFAVVILLVFLFSIARETEPYKKFLPTYSYRLSGNDLMKDFKEPPGELVRPGSEHRASATLLSLVRNEELEDLLKTMLDIENVFNKKFKYPWTFINDQPFTQEFKERTRKASNAQINYEIIPPEQWQEPPWINEDLKQASKTYLESQKVQYSSLESYHRMCRWNSGMFYKHPQLLNYRYYWRIEPKTHFFCDIDYDVFKFMEDNNKAYGFVINIYDSPQSVESLWPASMEFVAENPSYVHPNASIRWLTDVTSRPAHGDKAHGYSTCHFWSNFEIADMEFWRSEAYEKYFEYLDAQGGFFYERWGDAPVHSIGLGLFLDKSRIHWFRDVGYQHIPYFNCPNSEKCRGCQPGLFSDAQGLSDENCMMKWLLYQAEA